MNKQATLYLVMVMTIASAISACASLTDSEFSRLELETDRATYAMGDTIVLTVTNAGSRPWNFLSADQWACLTTVERRDADGWVDIVPPEACRDLVTPLSTLQPGARWIEEVAVEGPLFAPGERYRWRWKSSGGEAPSAVLPPSNEILILD
jgi:hypothetical protein